MWPTPLELPGPLGGCCTLGLGSMLKNTVALSIPGRIIVSAPHGDLQVEDARAARDATIASLIQRYEATPIHAACDLHPDDPGLEWATRHGCRIIRVQHHHAHIAAVMGEHELNGEVLGIAFDGYGYGEDGTAWGGEFLRCSRAGCERVGYLRAFRLPGGDQANREPRRAALGLLHTAGLETAPLRAQFSPTEFGTLRQMLERGVHAPYSTSVGRLFDAFAGLLGYGRAQKAESDAAQHLESLAGDRPIAEGYPFVWANGVLDWEAAVRAALDDVLRGVDPRMISARFHDGFVRGTAEAAVSIGLSRVALAGGCFLNRRLLQGLTHSLEISGHQTFAPRRLPPGDAALSYGQAVVALSGNT